MRSASVLRAALMALFAAGTVLSGLPAQAASSASPCSLTTQRPANWPAGEPGQVQLCSYSQDGLTRTAFVYVPSTLRAGAAVPVVVVLHGCTEQGPDIAYLSRFDSSAENHGYLVLYPNQADFRTTGQTSFDGNGSHCWNWFLPQNQQRGSGEPALIAGLTRQAAGIWHGDPARTYVIGISAGGAMSDIMAATYPDLYAASGIMAGCAYRTLPCLGSAGAPPPPVSGLWAYQASGSHARPVPFLVENGDADTVVPVANAFEVVQQMQVTDDYAANGGIQRNPVPPAPCASQTITPGPPVVTGPTPQVANAYDIYYYSQAGAACPKALYDRAASLGELWIVHGQEHAWPGGPPLTTGEIYTNPGGPDFTGAAYAFFMAHPCRVAAGACAPGA